LVRLQEERSAAGVVAAQVLDLKAAEALFVDRIAFASIFGSSVSQPLFSEIADALIETDPYSEGRLCCPSVTIPVVTSSSAL
jgi:hypothetical protein